MPWPSWVDGVTDCSFDRAWWCFIYFGYFRVDITWKRWNRHIAVDVESYSFDKVVEAFNAWWYPKLKQWIDNFMFHIIHNGSPFRLYRQHRTEIVVQMRSQIFRQIVHKFRRHTDVCQGICVQDAGKYASRCATKPSGGLCAVLPKVKLLQPDIKKE